MRLVVGVCNGKDAIYSALPRTNVLLKVRWQRINSTGTVQQSSPYTDEQRLSAAGPIWCGAFALKTWG